ncbi:hypothetical protein FD754_015372 [Muntiacus muntjak]|uniref:Uncharacterized protein n=1 Tax=Muntiacus muntjak TaxID=9888 RepID=A0A5N3VQ33_MUNMU|nr:hypothetical protein FD754_015372 [Muntiacus muntjak]
MNSEQPESQKDPDEKRKTSSEQCFSKVSEDQQDNSNTSQMKMDAKTSSESIDNTQAEGPRDQAVSPEKTIYVTLDININFWEDLNTLGVVRKAIKTHSGKEKLGYGAEGIDRFLDLGMPLRRFPENCHARKEEQVFGRFDNTSAVCVNVYIHAVGKTRKALLKRRQLHKNGYKFGVHAFKGESMRRLHRCQAPAARNSESQEIKPCVLEQSWQTSTLVRKEKVIKLEKTFESNLDKTRGEILCTHFFLGSVARSGTFHGTAGRVWVLPLALYISTCRHVTYWTVGEDIESRECARTLGRCVKVTFAYEKAEDENKHCFSVERWFETPDVKLDYPVLKLKRNGQQVPERQQTGVGHPDGEVKYTHACAVIPQDQREETYLEHIRARAADRRGACTQYIHMHTQRMFDSEGSLVAKHTAGFACKYPQGISSIIEFSCTLKSIIYAIKKKNIECGRKDYI